MPNFASPALLIDFARLPPPTVIETIAYEDLLTAYKTRVLAANPDLARALKLEQSPTNIILQAEAYAEMMVRARINAAARAVMLPFAVGSDLDALGALYNVQRAIIPADTSVTPPTPATPESDERYRVRIQMAPEAFSTAGSAGAYIFHALSADPTIRDVSAMRANDRGGVQISVMSALADPRPTDTQMINVQRRLYDKSIRPLTDVLSIVPAKVIHTTVDAELTLYAGPDAGLVMKDVQSAMQKLRARISLLGRNLTRSQLSAALNQEGVERVILKNPVQDILIDETTCVVIDSVSVSVATNRDS